MISYTQAVELLEQNAVTVGSETINTIDSLERINCSDIYSPLDLPGFNNSAMDGFALRYTETLNASPDNPLVLMVSDTIAAEVMAQKSAGGSMQCSEIMTGAAIPLGFDAVIPLEQVEEIINNDTRYIRLTAPVAEFDNVRFSGEDVKLATRILRAGQQIRACEIMLLLALGISQVTVYKPLTLAIASSGNEISDNYATELRYGEIYNSNSPLLCNLAAAKCYSARYAGILNDESKSLIDFISNSSEQILITTGAVSKGKWDFIPQTLRELGAEIIFHSVAIRPGKPILFARLKDGRFFFGLPGNPVSSIVGWRFFALPLFYLMWRKEREVPIKLKLQGNFNKSHKLRQFLKAEMLIKNGEAFACISKEQESFKIKALTDSNIWAIAEESQHKIAEGEMINAVPLYANL